MKIKTNDTVLIVKGKDRGRTGKVSRALPRFLKVIVEGVNLRKRHQRPRRGGEKGKVVTLAHPLFVANVKLICSSCKKPARVGYVIEGSEKRRICKKCKAII
jgi:large subunit ribosomal protein L24